MMFSAEPISAFVKRHPTVKVLALWFLLLIGVSLVGDGFGMHIPKGYIYFAMGFSVFVEMINLRVRKSGPPVKLHEAYVEEPVRTKNEERRTKNGTTERNGTTEPSEPRNRGTVPPIASRPDRRPRRRQRDRLGLRSAARFSTDNE